MQRPPSSTELPELHLEPYSGTSVPRPLCVESRKFLKLNYATSAFIGIQAGGLRVQQPESGKAIIFGVLLNFSRSNQQPEMNFFYLLSKKMDYSVQ